MPKPLLKKNRRAALPTAAIVAFSLTLLGGGIVLLSGLPLRGIAMSERLDIGTMLLLAPILALVLALLAEVAFIVLRAPDLPQPRQQQSIRWTPGLREG